MGDAAQLLSLAKRGKAVEHVCDTLGRDVVTELRACPVLRQARNTQRQKVCVAGDEPQLVKRIVWMASGYGRYVYRRITALLRTEGWWVNHKRVERIWRQEGLEVPAKQQRTTALAWRWVVHPASVDAPEPRLELRFRDGPDGRRSVDSDADDRGRVQTGVLGHRR